MIFTKNKTPIGLQNLILEVSAGLMEAFLFGDAVIACAVTLNDLFITELTDLLTNQNATKRHIKRSYNRSAE